MENPIKPVKPALDKMDYFTIIDALNFAEKCCESNDIEYLQRIATAKERVKFKIECFYWLDIITPHKHNYLSS